MILLPNSCTCSEPSVFPKNWKTQSASVKDDWRIQYYFKDPGQSKPKLVVVKRMNRYKTITERGAVTKMLLENEIKDLLAGYNCGHQYRPVSEDLVPKEIQQRVYNSNDYKSWKRSQNK